MVPKNKIDDHVSSVEAKSSMSMSLQTSTENLSKVESRNSLFKVYFAHLEQPSSSKDSNGFTNEWEVIGQGSWSPAIDTTSTISHQFCCIPGYGDTSIHVERMTSGTVHIYLDPISDLEISAKDIRSRIVVSSPSELKSLPTSPQSITDMSEESDSSMLERSFYTVKSPLSLAEASFKTDYRSFNSSMTHMVNRPCVTFVCDEISFVLTDDCVESYNLVSNFLDQISSSFQN